MGVQKGPGFLKDGLGQPIGVVLVTKKLSMIRKLEDHENGPKT